MREVNLNKPKFIKDLVDEKLWTNRMILKRFEIGKLISVSKMRETGFHFTYITQFCRKGEEQNVLFCYDAAYQFVDSKTIKIVEK